MLCTLLVLPDVNYGNSLDDSYCTEMQKAELLMYAIYPFQKCKFTHYCMWDIDWKRLDMIHSYTFTSDLTKKLKNITTSLWYRKEKKIWEQRQKYKIRKANTGRALLLHAALYEEFQRTDLSLVDLHSLY